MTTQPSDRLYCCIECYPCGKVRMKISRSLPSVQCLLSMLLRQRRRHRGTGLAVSDPKCFLSRSARSARIAFRPSHTERHSLVTDGGASLNHKALSSATHVETLIIRIVRAVGNTIVRATNVRLYSDSLVSNRMPRFACTPSKGHKRGTVNERWRRNTACHYRRCTVEHV
jgi:hypothetical protein